MPYYRYILATPLRYATLPPFRYALRYFDLAFARFRMPPFSLSLIFIAARCRRQISLSQAISPPLIAIFAAIIHFDFAIIAIAAISFTLLADIIFAVSPLFRCCWLPPIDAISMRHTPFSNFSIASFRRCQAEIFAISRWRLPDCQMLSPRAITPYLAADIFFAAITPYWCRQLIFSHFRRYAALLRHLFSFSPIRCRLAFLSFFISLWFLRRRHATLPLAFFDARRFLAFRHGHWADFRFRRWHTLLSPPDDAIAPLFSLLTIRWWSLPLSASLSATDLRQPLTSLFASVSPAAISISPPLRAIDIRHAMPPPLPYFAAIISLFSAFAITSAVFFRHYAIAASFATPFRRFHSWLPFSIRISSPIFADASLIFHISLIAIDAAAAMIFAAAGCHFRQFSPPPLYAADAAAAISPPFCAPPPPPPIEAQFSRLRRRHLRQMRHWWYFFVAADCFRLPLPSFLLHIFADTGFLRWLDCRLRWFSQFQRAVWLLLLIFAISDWAAAYFISFSPFHFDTAIFILCHRQRRAAAITLASPLPFRHFRHWYYAMRQRPCQMFSMFSCRRFARQLLAFT